MLNFKDLKYFKSLSNTFSFTKTANEFYVSQPTISNGIKNLEKHFNVKLINREKFGKSISFTENGLELLEVVNQIENTVKVFEEKLKQKEEKNEIVIGIPPIVDNEIFKSFLFEIFNINNLSNINIILEEHYMIELHKMLEDQRVDLIIGYTLEKKNYMKDVKNIFLKSLKINLYEKKISDKTEKLFRRDNLENVKIISLQKPSMHSVLIEKLLNEFKVEPKEIIYVKDFTLCEALIENGIGIGIFGEKCFSANKKIVSKDIETSITLDLFLAYNYLKTNSYIRKEILEKITSSYIYNNL